MNTNVQIIQIMDIRSRPLGWGEVKNKAKPSYAQLGNNSEFTVWTDLELMA